MVGQDYLSVKVCEYTFS